MFTCKNGTQHQHTTTYESRVCWGLITLPALPTPPVYTPPPSFKSLVTEPQLSYIRKLGGDMSKTTSMTRLMASDYIDQLKRAGRKVQQKIADPREAMLAELIKKVPDGYFCTQMDGNAKMNFVRISRPKVGKKTWGGAIKIQTQHGPRLEVAAAVWPSGSFSIYDQDILDILMLLVSDYRSCALRYAKELNHCCRCNLELTDERSRHYGIGPICDKIWTWVIDLVDDQNDGKSFEELSRV